MKFLILGLLFCTSVAFACSPTGGTQNVVGCPAGCYSKGACAAGNWVGACDNPGDTGSCAIDGEVCTMAGFWGVYYSACCCGPAPLPGPVGPGPVPVDPCGGVCGALGATCMDCGAPIGWSCVTSLAMCGGPAPIGPGPGPIGPGPILPGPGPIIPGPGPVVPGPGPIIPAPVNPCAGSGVCGKAFDLGPSAALLPDVVIEIRDSTGKVIDAFKTAANGSYYRPMGDGVWIVNPVVKRNSAAQPSQKAVRIAGGIPSSVADFRIRALSVIKLSNLEQGTFVLVSRNPVPGTQVPVMDTTTTAHYAATAGSNRQVRIEVPAGFSYSIACWGPSIGSNNRTKFSRLGGSGASTTLPAPAPNITVDAVCP